MARYTLYLAGRNGTSASALEAERKAVALARFLLAATEVRRSKRLDVRSRWESNRRRAADLGLKLEGPHGPASLDEDEYR